MELFLHLRPDSTVLTPNRRLTAIIKKKYIEHQLKQGIHCWKTLDILPLYPAWLERTFKAHTAKTFLSPVKLLTQEQEMILWEKILREAPQNEFLFQMTSTAKLAKSAWDTLRQWQISLNDSNLTATEDSRAFLSWAHTFKTLCKKNHWLDQHALANEIMKRIKEGLLSPPPHLVLVGFTEITPQYQALFKHCEEAGTCIEFYTLPSTNQTAKTVSLTDTESEIYAMARFAKAHMVHSTSIGCIIPQLSTLREKVVRIFSAVFGEELFNVSAGKPLSAYPIIHDAFLFAALQRDEIPLKLFSRLLKSPFLGEALEEQSKRIVYDAKLRQANLTTFSLSALLKSSHALSLKKNCPALARRLKEFLNVLPPKNTTLTPSQWVVCFNQLLKILGWPGPRSINSEEYQVIQSAWLPLLNRYATLEPMLGEINFKTALHYLKEMATQTIFQPESPEASVQVLGVLEAAGVPFEHAWMMGLDDTQWPPKPRPNPFIPIRLQKDLKMPNASSERELIYCQQLTQQFLQSNTHIIFSYPVKKDDTELRPSTLLSPLTTIPFDEVLLSPFMDVKEKIFASRQWDYFNDDKGPPIKQDSLLQGGVKIFKAQAECPFKAFAELRLHAKPMEETTLGVRKLDRGNIVHAALEFLWGTLKDSATLHAKTDVELNELIKEAADVALKKVLSLNNNNRTRYLALEQQRLEKLLMDWLYYEKMRSPFRIHALEHPIQIHIGPIVAEFRIDRIDELLIPTGNKQLLIDYKTGKNIRRADWFGKRLNEPQLPLYCLAHAENTIALAFAKIHPDRIELQGASGTLLPLPGIEPLGAIKQADATLWDEQIKHWREALLKLSEDFFQGIAKVDPKDPQTCRQCDLQAFCRIHEIQSNLVENSDEPS